MNFRKTLFPLLLAPALLATGAFAGDPSAYRHSHATTLMPDGNVLITGGRSGAGDTATAAVEMYNMKTGNYDSWGTLNLARSSHTATLMSNGQVLIAGGFQNSGVPTNSLEICNPITTACTNASSNLTTPRGSHTATLLTTGAHAGQVMICGGQDLNGTSTTESCEFVEPGTANNVTVTAGPDLVSPRAGHTASLLKGGRVFVSGGRRYSGGAWIYEAMNEMYDPGLNVWTPVSSLLQGRVCHTATVLNNGLVMIAGGYNETTNILYCQATSENSLEDECWHIRNLPDTLLQDAGTHGLIDGAEFYDSNGARVAIQESTQGEMPYRVMNHTAGLEQGGRWRMQGGYGAIVPTFFNSAPPLTENTIIYLQQVAGSTNTATILNTSVIEFPLDFTLSRPVSGRLVDTDLFISPPAEADTPSFALENAEFDLGPSTAPADGKAVGLLLGDDYAPGDFESDMQLLNPNGTATFDPYSVASEGTTSTGGTLDIENDEDLLPGETKAISGSLITQVTFQLPNIYRGGVQGVALVTSGQVEDDGGEYVITLEESGSGGFAFTTTPATDCDDEEGVCTFTGSITFTALSGTISNMTTATLDEGTTFTSPLSADLNGDSVLLALDLDYAADEVHILDNEPTYSFDRSTAVVREMIFSSQLAYYPDTNRWSDLSDEDESPALVRPVFNHTALYTPGQDTLLFGGRNCEGSPAADCARAAKNFSAVTGTRTVLTPVYLGANGSDSWPESTSLNSRRAFHSSTLLPDGSILTCGGSDGVKPLDTCELMDPDTKIWTPTGSMNMPRANHTATLLPNGNVLVAGGITPLGVAISSAEVFYPDTQRWVPTSPMSEPRQLHTATLMPDGNVLVTGGATSSTYSATTEIYISSTAYWMSGGDLQDGRSQHTATLLKNGNVIIAGGINGFGAMRETEVYDYTNRTSAAGPLLNVGRYDHTATLLRDGNVIIIGGSNGVEARSTTELYNGTNWTPSAQLSWARSNHAALLLPNGKVMVTGGEMRGTMQSVPESFDPDFRTFTDQGTMTGRMKHTAMLTRDNYILNIGGWSGGEYLNTTEMIPFSLIAPDMRGLTADTTRQAEISTCTAQFDRGDYATLLSDTSNFHGITEASGGGTGSANSSFHNPRVYMQQIDNDSGFLVDLSTYIYSHYSGPNTDWEATLSSITIITPTEPGSMPHGWYNVRVAAAGVYSAGTPVQVTVPRPTGIATAPTATVHGTSSMTWTWNQNTLSASDGYALYSSSDNVFIATVAFTNPASYTQANMSPNTEISIKVCAYNLGGNGELAQSSTYYTLAAVPDPLSILEASFENALLEWSANGNSERTTYEVSMSPQKSPKFSDPTSISTPVPFTVNYLSTSTLITSLSPNVSYDFRVRAMNGAGVATDFCTPASTVTVGGVNNFSGQALSSSTVNWSWDESDGADYYEIYSVDVSTDIDAAYKVGTSSANSYSQTHTYDGIPLAANNHYTNVVLAVKTTADGPIRGPASSPVGVYTLTVQPLLGVPNVFTNISTGSITANWITNGNSTWTVYSVYASTFSGAEESSHTYTTRLSTQAFNSLEPNIEYFFTLTPFNGDGIAGTAVDLGSKYTLAKVPASLAPTNISMSGIWLSWDTDGNSEDTIYELRSSTDEAFADPVTTHILFAEAYTSSYTFVNGLLTATSYYFDVAARNGETVVTARKRALATYTLEGPSNAPTGSIGGTSDPAEQSLISGTLPSGRTVSITVPAGAFPEATAIAVSSGSMHNYCSYLPDGVIPIEIDIFTENNAQPQVPVTLTLSYTSDEANTPSTGITANGSKVVLARYNPVSGQCLPLETTLNTGARTVTATLNHFSTFQLMVHSAAASLNSVAIYPNPFYPNRGQGFVTIDRIPANAKIRIYTLSGDKVWEASAGTTGVVIWRGVNKSGNLVASGVYLAVIDSSAGKKVMKIAVER